MGGSEVMLDSSKTNDIRCPIHGFIPLTKWELSLVNSPVFQRLRRIRQLAWTDFVYPGAMHTRFEHSLGVMHVATLLFDSIRRNSEAVLKEKYGYSDHGLDTVRQKIRLAALLHDVGHAPFSHATEELFPCKHIEGQEGVQLSLEDADKSPARYKHEDYSYALIRHTLRSAIEDHDDNRKNYKISADDIADLLQGSPSAGSSLIWKAILDHQLDADRMDYLLRDSHHLGVNYGKYDLHRLISSVCAFELSREDGSKSVRIGVLSGGLHAAESLVIARYWMYKQVYQHKTRLAFDLHLKEVMKELLLPNNAFPPPLPDRLQEYLSWDDWKVQGMLSAGQGGEHASCLEGRSQYRQIYKSDDRLAYVTDPAKKYAAYLEENKTFDKIAEALQHMGVKIIPSENIYYKNDEAKSISIVNEADFTDVQPLVQVSPIGSLNTFDQRFIYGPPVVADEARGIAKQISYQARIERQKLHSGEADRPPNNGLSEKKDNASVGNLKLVVKEEANAR